METWNFFTYALQCRSVRRLVAIVTLFVFLLNVLGYYGVLVGLKKDSTREVSKRLDSEMYDLGAKVTFRIPLTVPYGVDSRNYEPVKGQFEKDGEVYHLVKQRLYKDTLYIECIKDDKTTGINNTLADLVQSFAGHQDDGNQASMVPTLMKDYLSTQVAITPAIDGWEQEFVPQAALPTFADSFFVSIIHPPDNRA